MPLMNGDDSGSRGSHDENAHTPGEQQRILLAIFATSERALSTTDVSKLTDQTLGATAHHVRTLAARGYLAKAREHRVRGALQVFYVASPKGERALRVPRIAALLQLTGMVGDLRTQAGGLVRPLLPTNWDEDALRKFDEVVEDVRPRLEAILQEILDNEDR